MKANTMDPIGTVLEIAAGEIGYLEKKNGKDLYDKTKNAGDANYTKYWAEIKPAYQGQPWCACFVTWCLVKAFGQENARMLLGHYPFVYVPTLAGMHDQNPTPRRGDIVCFYRGGEFVHTGLVERVSGDVFCTIEGNTSGGSSTIIANGGGVCRKSYYTSALWGTKFIRPHYEKLQEDEKMTEQEKQKFNALVGEVGELTQRVDRLETPVYAYVDENMPEWARTTVTKLYQKGILRGDEQGRLNLDENLLRVLVINDRAGLYDGK